MSTTFVQHNRIRLALHTLRASALGDGASPPLVLLHGLGEKSPSALPAEYASWPGAIHALDFTGHGESTVPRGGGYTCELLLGDVDAVLAQLGPCTLAGRGLGAYVALLAAGARPQLVRGAILRDGPGLPGGGPGAATPFVPYVDPRTPAPPDPFALVELAVDIRPADYACVFVRHAVQASALSRPVSVCAAERPAWLAAICSEMGVEVTQLREALAFYAQPNS